jgi:hypothetical protein
MFRKGSIITFQDGELVIAHDDLIGELFWKKFPRIVY